MPATIEMSQTEVREALAIAVVRAKYRSQRAPDTSELTPYEPLGASRDAIASREPQLVIGGPAGTGKSRSCLEKLHRAALEYPGMRGLIVRKTRHSLTQSAMVTFKQKVLPPNSSVHFHVSDQEYRYPNGSVIVVGGLDKPTKVMSAEYDLVYPQEATELTQEDWESLSSRMRNGVMPYQQMIGDCNPGAPTHWLRRRMDAGVIKELTSRHEDNPTLWDVAQQRWTPRGAAYIAELDKLEGARKLRLRYGRWAAAEGLVYEGWDAAVNVLDRFEIPAGWRRFRVIDFGYSNPFCCLWFALDPDDRLYLYREIYKTGLLVEDAAAQIIKLSEGESIEATIADHDAEDRATLVRHGIATVAAKKEVSPGIQDMQARIRKAGDGKPRLYILRDSTVERDASLVERGKPASTLEEIDGYAWEKQADGKPNKEAPRKVDDHGVDATRYMVRYFDASNTIGWA